MTAQEVFTRVIAEVETSTDKPIPEIGSTLYFRLYSDLVVDVRVEEVVILLEDRMHPDGKYYLLYLGNPSEEVMLVSRAEKNGAFESKAESVTDVSFADLRVTEVTVWVDLPIGHAINISEYDGLYYSVGKALDGITPCNWKRRKIKSAIAHTMRRDAPQQFYRLWPERKAFWKRR